MISEIYILFFKASLTIRHTATVSQKKGGTSKKIQWDFQISRVGSLDFLDLKVNGSPAQMPPINTHDDISSKASGKNFGISALASLHTPKPLLFADVISTQILCTGPHYYCELIDVW